MMRKLPATAQEIKDYRARFYHIPGVRRDEIRERLADNDQAGAIALPEKSRAINKQSDAWLLPEYSRKLIDLYRETGQTEKYKQELWSYNFHLLRWGLYRPLQKDLFGRRVVKAPERDFAEQKDR